MLRFLLLVAALAALFYWVFPAIPHTPSPIEQTIERQLKDLNRDVESLQKQSQAAGAKTRKEVDDQLSALRRQIQDSEKKLSDARASNRGRWASLRQQWDRWFGSKKPA